MNCPRCGAAAQEGAAYCASCGTSLPLWCPSCRAANERSSNFCFSCGTALAAPGPAAPADPVPSEHPQACPRCQEPYQPGSSYCLACGFALDAAPTTAFPTPSAGGFAAWFRERPDAPAYSMGRPAGFWIRLVAFLVDAFLLLVVFFAALPLVTGQNFIEFVEAYEDSTEIISRADLLNLGLNILYFTAAVALWATTIGKRLFKMYVVRSDGSRVGPGRALLRYFASQLSLLLVGIGYIMIGVRSDKRGLHDLICDTVVIIRPPGR